MQGRTLAKISDFSLSEQLFLYDRARQLKSSVVGSQTEQGNIKIEKSTIDSMRLEDARRKTAYLIFMENSTRTKESFRNAALFHDVKVNDFDCATSSFAKGETITDCLKMLVGYSEEQSLLGSGDQVVEDEVGVAKRNNSQKGAPQCQKFCPRHRLPAPSFINAGDGKHEHPTQELLDEFTFLEHLRFDRTRIHIALVGDLFHGRTVHSKVDGLKVFESVHVDLIAPDELAMPEHYVERMRDADHCFVVRKFASIDEYLKTSSSSCTSSNYSTTSAATATAAADEEKGLVPDEEREQGSSAPRPGVAPIWYFTRLQLERMSQAVQDKSVELRKAVTFSPERHQTLIDVERTKFYHPLPRDSRHPVIPFEIDDTTLNGWDQQSRNGYFVRTMLLAMVGGKFDEGYQEGGGGRREEEDKQRTAGGPPKTSEASSEVLMCDNPNCVSFPANGQREVLPWIVKGVCKYCDKVVAKQPGFTLAT
eukprot:g11723.t1